MRNLVKKGIGIKELYLHSKHKNEHEEQSKDSKSTRRRKSINIKERIHFHPRMITYELLEISKPSRIQNAVQKQPKKKKSQNPLNVCHEITCGVDLD